MDSIIKIETVFQYSHDDGGETSTLSMTLTSKSTGSFTAIVGESQNHAGQKYKRPALPTGEQYMSNGYDTGR
jgi:hypothetical protein